MLDRLLEETRRAGETRAEGPYRGSLLGSLFIRLTEPPYRMKVKTFPGMVPAAGRPLADVLPAYEAQVAALAQRVQGAAGLDLGARRTKNLAKVPLSTAQWFRFTLAHQRRHLWQARGVRNHSNFPAA